MMPKGTSSIPTPEPSITTSGSAVVFRLVSLVVIVTVINVLEVMLSVAPELVGSSRARVVFVAVVERKLPVVRVAFAAMVSWNRWAFGLSLKGLWDAQFLVWLLVTTGILPLVWWWFCHKICRVNKNKGKTVTEVRIVLCWGCVRLTKMLNLYFIFYSGIIFFNCRKKVYFESG